MPTDTEKTEIFATYTTRREAEMARDHLADAGIQSFVKSDDAGGMYPQLQNPHGVMLVGMSGTAQRARTRLDDAGLLPDENLEASSTDPEGPSKEMANSMYGLVLLLAVAAVALVLLMIVLG